MECWHRQVHHLDMTVIGARGLELQRTDDGYTRVITRRTQDGAVVWRAVPPEGGGDVWVKVAVEQDVVVATSWSGWHVRLALDTGAEISRRFTK